MKTITIIALFTLLFSLNGFSQSTVKFRVERQAMSTPMSTVDEIFFLNYYSSKPVNVIFDGSILNMIFDNGAKFIQKSLTEVACNNDYEDGILRMKTVLYTDNNNASDTISFVVDHQVGYYQIVLPAKNSKDEYIGYTSYKQFDKSLIKSTELAAK